MRHLDYGQFDAQFANFTARSIRCGSQIIDGSPSNYDYGKVTDQSILYMLWDGSSPYDRRRIFFKCAMDELRAQIGHNAVIVRAKLCFFRVSGASTSMSVGLYRTLNPPTYGDCSNRYRDITGAITWTNDAYAPMPDVDVRSTAISTTAYTSDGSADTTVPSLQMDITSELKRVLRAGIDLQVMFTPEAINTVSQGLAFNYSNSAFRPYLSIDYLEPLEFYRAKISGGIDLSQLLDNQTGLEEDDLDLGSLQRNETGSSVKFFVKNFSGGTFSIVELWDDYPEWTDPVQTTGTGTGSLDYATLAEDSVSQKYTVKMLSGSTFEVKAEAYSDNTTGLHTSFDANPSWQKTTGSDFTAPDGGLTIPSAAWTAGTLVNDEFEFFVHGNSSDSTWASDSNDQTYITSDDSGSPLSTGWRRVDGQRTVTTASVSIDATTKTVSTKNLISALWIVGQPCFITDGTNTDEGTVQSATATSVTITGLTAGAHTYAAGSRVGTTLLLGSLGASVWAQSTAAFGASSSPANRIPLSDPAGAGYIAAQSVFIASVDNADVYEEAVIQTVGSTYIDLTAVMASDYESGALVIVLNSGEAAAWARAVTNGTTTEELKRVRINART